MGLRSLTVRLGLLVSMLPFALAGGCGGGDGGNGAPPGGGGGGGGGNLGPPPTDVIDPEPGAGNTVMRLFSRPFANEYQVLNYFDHDRPIHPNDTNAYQLTWRGTQAVPGRDIAGYDGHLGIDWLLPENPPLFAVTGGEVVFAGESTGPCILQDNEVVTALIVRLKFVAPNGDTYVASYAHLNRIDVAVGDLVTEGQQLGLSGATGCVGKRHIPHLHFLLQHYVSLNPVEAYVVDPYGWEGPGPDPWAAQGPGRTSVWLWKQGQAPDMVPWRQQ
jgi:murein DD-endopeptidase MepM/ murein hydrolase activator NlpD